MLQNGAGSEVLGNRQEHIFQIAPAVEGDIHIDILAILQDKEFLVKEGLVGICSNDDDLFAAIVANDAGIFS